MQNLPKINFFFNGDFTPFQIWDHFFPVLFPQGFQKYKKFGHYTLGRGGKNTFIRSEQMKKNPEKKTFFCRGNFRPILSKTVQIWDHFFPLLFPKDYEYLKSLDIGL